ncbi:MAG TPA: dienelactone hydrolase family protein [Anaeromyxobacteraceae bacterium]|nr:dienelactone hydrolase family protein [Anaeromyxobacteraceae bacterium]
MGQTISFPRVDGKPARGYLAEAQTSKGPGVVVIQEWWGLQGQIQGVCDRLAEAGFTALAPDLYNGKVVPYHDRDAAAAAMQALDFREATEQAVRGAVKFLASRGGKVGLTGFCMGGAVTVIGAARIPELSAAVAFYGLPPPQVATAKDVRVPLQGHFASRDEWVTPQLADQFEKDLRAAGKTFEFHRYEGDHAFMNSERREVHDAKAAKLAWDRMIAFFRKHLA